MANPRQQKLAREIVENMRRKVPKNKTQLSESAGYSHATAITKAGRTIAQKGVQEELVILGFSEYEAKQVVGEILKDKEQQPRDRLKAADMIFKVQSSYAPEKHEHSIEESTDPLLNKLLDQYEQDSKQSLAEGSV